MIKVLIDGEVKTVTSRHGMILIEKGQATAYEEKQEKAAVETKEEKRKRRTK